MNNSSTADLLCFWRSWTSAPLRVAAITPSGSALAELITSEISPDCGPILELGPGTGVFTRALLARGIRAEDLTLVENGAEFIDLLRNRFPAVRVLWLDAAQLRRHALFDDAAVGAVVSGIPLLSMPPRRVLAILTEAFRLLRADGAFYQFTYGFKCPISQLLLDRLGLSATCQGHVYLNMPPATVYRITRLATTA